MATAKRYTSVKILLILATVITIGGCVVLWNNLYTPTCDLEQEIQSQYLLHPKIPDVYAIIDFAPINCDVNPSFLKNSPMKTITRMFAWNHRFCLGEKVAIETYFGNDGYGCGEFGNLIILGPSLQIFFKNDNH